MDSKVLCAKTLIYSPAGINCDGKPFFLVMVSRRVSLRDPHKLTAESSSLPESRQALSDPTSRSDGDKAGQRSLCVSLSFSPCPRPSTEPQPGCCRSACERGDLSLSFPVAAAQERVSFGKVATATHCWYTSAMAEMVYLPPISYSSPNPLLSTG